MEENIESRSIGPHKSRRMTFYVGIAIIAIVAIIFLIVIGKSITTIQPGYAGIIYDMNGGVEQTTLSQGVHLVAPWKQVTSYPVSTETVYFSKSNSEGGDIDESVSPGTADGKVVNMDVSYTYHYDVNKLPHIFTKFRGQSADDISNNYIRQYMKNALNDVTTTYGIFDIYGTKRSEVAAKVYKAFSNALLNDGIIIESFSIIEVRPDSETMKGIQNKVDAEQALETSMVKLKQAQIDAETAITKAKGQAQANKVLEASINSTLNTYNEINKWDGKLPTTVAGSNSGLGLLVNGSSDNPSSTKK